MLNITNLLKKCQSKLQWVFSSHQSEWSLSHLKIIIARENMKKREPLYISGGNTFWCSYSGHHSGNILKKVKIVTVWSRNPTLGIYLGKTKTNLKRFMCPNVYSSTIDSQDMKAAWVYQQIIRCVHIYIYAYIYTQIYNGILISQRERIK